MKKYYFIKKYSDDLINKYIDDNNNNIVYVNNLSNYMINIFLLLYNKGYNYSNTNNIKTYTYNTFIDYMNLCSFILLRRGNKWCKIIDIKKLYNDDIDDKIFKNHLLKIVKKYGVESSIGNYSKKIFYLENIYNIKKYFLKLKSREFDFADKSFRSGLCMLAENKKNKIIKNVNLIDINSLYPYIMKNYNLPIREGLYYEGEYKKNKLYNLFIQHIKANFELKKDGFDFLSFKNTFKNENIKTSNGLLYDLFLTNYDLENFYKNYDIYEIYYIDGYKYLSTNKLFKKYIDKFYKKRQNTKNKKIKKFYKLLLNSLFGRLATKKTILKKEPIIKNNKINIKINKKPIKTDGGYIVASSFITSIARNILLKDIEKVKNDFIYCDTDSIHFVDNNNIKNFNISKKLGDYKIEIKRGTAKYLKLKTYIIADNKKIKKVVAGVPAEHLKNINIKNFKIGKKIEIKKNIIKDNKKQLKKYIIKI